MKFNSILVGALLTISATTCRASDSISVKDTSILPKWTTTNIALETVADASLIVDWGQTLNIDNKYRGQLATGYSYSNYYHETNVLLGRHPSRGAINAYFGSILATKVVAALFLSQNTRNIVNASFIGVEIYAISKNVSVGFNMKF